MKTSEITHYINKNIYKECKHIFKLFNYEKNICVVRNNCNFDMGEVIEYR